MKDIVVLSLLGSERLNIEGFIEYHSPWVSRFEFVHHNADEYSLEICRKNSKCRLTYTELNCFNQEDKARNFLQDQIDYHKETALLLDLDERLDLRTLGLVTNEHFKADVTIGIIHNSDNYFLVDGYPRQLFSNKRMNFKNHTHSWADIAGKSVFYLDYPKVNHVIQKPYKKPGAETDEDVEQNPSKFLDKKLANCFMHSNYQKVVSEYIKYKSYLETKRSPFMCYMIAVLACERMEIEPPFDELPFFDSHPTKTEMAIKFIRSCLEKKSATVDLSLYLDNPFGITSSYAKAIAKKRGAIDGMSADMWRT